MEIHLLPWAAQMNVHADSLATDFLDNYAAPSKLVPFIPASRQASPSMGKPSLAAVPLDYAKLLTVHEFANISWPGMIGPMPPSDPSTGRLLARL
jgi:hypothetical protein